MKCNPCVLCGGLPSVGEWNAKPDYSHAAYCYNDLKTHAIQCNGHNLTEAIKCWNLLNPLPGETAKRTKRDRFSALPVRTIKAWLDAHSVKPETDA